MDTKVCKTCAQEKEIKFFYFHKTTGYYFRECITCINNKRRKGKRILVKCCRVCEEEKTLNNENFSRYKGSYDSVCRQCSGVRIYPNSRFLVEEDKGKQKKCNKCGEEKNLIDNYYYSRANKTYGAYCIQCVKNPPSKQSQQVKITKLIRTTGVRDKKRLQETDLSREFVKTVLTSPCVYCGFPATGLDRLNNSIGHIESNCVPCCKECNIARNNNFSYEEMLEIGKTIKSIKLKRENKPIT